MKKLDAAALKQACPDRSNSPCPCTCAVGACRGWESLTEARWPVEQMQALGTLREVDAYEPTLDEHHPSSTRYESADAPIAVDFYPYNRCDVHQCSRCARVLLRYTEFGGYYVDHRVREVDPALIVQE